MKVLFAQGGLLESEKSVTVQAMEMLKNIKAVRVLGQRPAGSRGARPVHVLSVWPEDEGNVEILKKDLKQIYKVVTAYFKANFPHWEYMNALRALDVHSQLTMTQRKTLVDRIAAQWQIDGSSLWLLAPNQSI